MIAYTDGACQGNGKENARGGFGVVVLDDNEKVIEYYQHFEEGTTNNRQEMKAIIWAMAKYGKRGPLTIYSDSAYSVNTFETWMYTWFKNDWKKSNKQKPENLDLVQAFYNLIQDGYKCKFELIRGHQGNKWNEMADKLATGSIKL